MPLLPLLRSSHVVAQLDSRKDSGMVATKGFSAEARPQRLLFPETTTMLEARGVPLLRASRLVAGLRPPTARALWKHTGAAVQVCMG